MLLGHARKNGHAQRKQKRGIRQAFDFHSKGVYSSCREPQLLPPAVAWLFCRPMHQEIHISGVSRLQYEGNAEHGEPTLYLYDRIYPWEADGFTYIHQEMSWRKGKLNLWRNTPGGDVFAANAIANLLKSASYEVHTWSDGLAASMGSVFSSRRARKTVTLLATAS